MYYVEYLFARTRLLWFTAICLAMATVFTIFVTKPPAGVHIQNNGQDVSANAMFIGAAWFASIMASILSTTLNRDQSHLAYIWTRPIPRERIALSYMLVDVLAILASFGIAIAVAAMVFAVPPANHITTDSQTGAILARSLAVPLMLYGIVEVATSWSPLRIGAAIGIFWGVAWVLLILAAISWPAPLGQILIVLNAFNPLAYFPEVQGHGAVVSMSMSGANMLPLPFAAQTLLAFAIFVTALTLAIYNWKRMEA